MARALLLLVAPLLGACDDYVLPSSCGEERSAAVIRLEGAVEDGEAAFVGSCAPCHDLAGDEAKVGPALRPIVPEATDEELVTIMACGFVSMPPSNVDDQQAADVLAWLRDTFGGG